MTAEGRLRLRILFATCSPDEAESLARRLLEERLVGCANLIGGVRSLYHWEGEICQDEEVVILMETTDDLATRAAARLRELHGYDVPKIVILDPVDCDRDYLAWLEGVTRGE